MPALVRASLLFAILGSLILSGCKIPQQDPRFIFADEKMPRSLERVANQKREMPSERIENRLKADAQIKNLLPVGVIDNGFDLAHPLLVDRYTYKMDSGLVTGVGFDAMGNDAFPSPNLIDASLFAYSSNALVDGKIVPSTDEPLELILKHQKRFYEILMADVLAHSVLNKSLLAKKLELSSVYFSSVAENLSMFQETLDSEKDDKEERAKNRLVDEISHPSDVTKRNFEKLKKDGKFGWIGDYNFYFERWLPEKMDSGDGFMSKFNYPDNTMYDFIRLAVGALQKLDNETKALTHLKNMNAYLQAAEGKKAEEATSSIEKAAEIAGKSLNYKIFGYLSLSPLFKMVQNLRQAATIEALNKMENFPTKSVELSRGDLVKALDRMMDLLDKSLQDSIVSKKGEESVELLKLKKLDAEKTWIRARLKQYLLSVPEKAIQVMDPKLFPRDNTIERYLIRTTHPFIAKNSNKQSHGTHVSGTIAIQDPNIRIFPIRVVTSDINLTVFQIEKAQAALTKEFSKWLENPLVFRAFQNRMAPFVASKKSITRKQVIQDFLKSYQPFINSYVMKNGLNIEFHNQILRAIEEVGKNKLKIVSMSLGLENEAAVKNETNDLDEAARKAVDIDFLMFEWMKFSLGNTIQQKASKSLFVVAAGNSGKWIDAEAQSALPVDISSPWLRRFSQGTETAPNNELTNVLGVGSINPTGNLLSSFTNLIIGSNAPVVFAVGEDVVAPIKVTDISLLEEMTNTLAPDAKGLSRNLQINSAKDSLKQERSFENLKEKMLNRELEEKISETIESFVKTLILDHFTNQDKFLGRMSGTSMATPNTSGLIAKEVIQLMAQRGLNWEQIYDHPDFTPQKLIELIMTKTTSLRSGNIVESLKKLTGEKEYSDEEVLKMVKNRLFNFTPKATAVLSQPKQCKTLLTKDPKSL